MTVLAGASQAPACRLCGSRLELTFVDLGSMPLANSYPGSVDEAAAEASYPLHVRVCESCWLVQLDDVVRPDILFSDYAYFSSYSSSWLDHARFFAEAAVRSLRLGPESLVVEVASNDGYLLDRFRVAGIPVLGIEPAANVASAAIAAGVPTDVAFFGRDVAERMVEDGLQADLLVANNVLAHVPDLNDFVAGMATVLKPDGVASIEVPHLLKLIERVEFDTIYHEHYSYFSLLSAQRALEAQGLVVFDVESLPTHGGSLRIWAARRGAGRSGTARVAAIRQAEEAAGLTGRAAYESFAARVEDCRRSLNSFLAAASENDQAVVAYGAAAKGSTLLTYCGCGPGDIQYVVDRSPHKQGKLMPGSHLPIHPPERVDITRPDFLLILAWNLRSEISAQMAHVRTWGGRFVTPVPKVEVFA